MFVKQKFNLFDFFCKKSLINIIFEQPKVTHYTLTSYFLNSVNLS